MTTVLSSNDQFVPPVLVKFIIVFRANALNDLEKAQNLFRKAVEKAIPAAVDARVERNAKTKQFQLVKDSSVASPLFQVVQAPRSAPADIAECDECQPSADFEKGCAPHPWTWRCSTPPIVIKFVRFQCGVVTVTVAVHHAVADLKGIAMLCADWLTALTDNADNNDDVQTSVGSDRTILATVAQLPECEKAFAAFSNNTSPLRAAYDFLFPAHTTIAYESVGKPNVVMDWINWLLPGSLAFLMSWIPPCRCLTLDVNLPSRVSHDDVVVTATDIVCVIVWRAFALARRDKKHAVDNRTSSLGSVIDMRRSYADLCGDDPALANRVRRYAGNVVTSNRVHRSFDALCGEASLSDEQERKLILELAADHRRDVVRQRSYAALLAAFSEHWIEDRGVHDGSGPCIFDMSFFMSGTNLAVSSWKDGFSTILEADTQNMIASVQLAQPKSAPAITGLLLLMPCVDAELRARDGKDGRSLTRVVCGVMPTEYETVENSVQKQLALFESAEENDE